MWRIIKKVFRNKAGSISKQPFPDGWSKTMDDLFEEMKNGTRSEIRDPELTWAREYERSLIPAHYRFPRKGDLYAAKFDQDVDFLTHWMAPFTGGGKTRLLAGEQIWIPEDPDGNKAISVSLLPVEYGKLEERMISREDRESFKYNGYNLNVDTVDLNEKIELISVEFSKELFI